MKKRRIVILLFCVLLLVYGIHWAFFCIQRIDGQELLAQSCSPDGAYTVTAYLNNGGATTGYGVLCSVKNNETGRERNIYWMYRCDGAEIQWIDDVTVKINGVSLNVLHEAYDWRRQ